MRHKPTCDSQPNRRRPPRVARGQVLSILTLAAAALGLSILHFTASATARATATTMSSGLPQPGKTVNFLTGVSCPSAKDCWAAGTTDAFGEILRWDGKRWAIAYREPNANFHGLTCASAGDCWTFGSIGIEHEIVLHWNGTKWVSTPVPDSHYADLQGMSCTSKINCWAVGTGEDYRPLALHWNGARWSSSAVSGGRQELDGITCVTEKDCWAFGDSYNHGPGYVTAYHWTGAKWTSAWTGRQYEGASGDVAMTGVSCVSARDCWAAGYLGTTSETHGMLLHLSGATWRATASPAVDNDYWYYTDVACVSSHSCWAVGSDGQIISRTSAGWVKQPTTTNGTLYGVACTSANNCWAVGGAGQGGQALNLALHWDGKSWRSY